MHIRILSVVFLLSSTLLKHDNSGTEWQLKSSKNGISVYTKSVNGASTSAVKSVCVMNSPLSGLVALVLDVNAYKKWIFHCDHAVVLKNISNSELVYYQETSVPWPAANRDFIAWLKITQDKKTGIITATIENLPDYIPEKPGKVRLRQFKEKVVIVPKGKGKSEFSYEMFMDAGGNIPGWMVNMAITDGPYESLVEMEKLVNTGAYKNARYPFIKEMY